MNPFILRHLLCRFLCKPLCVFLILYPYMHTHKFLHYLIKICENFIMFGLPVPHIPITGLSFLYPQFCLLFSARFFRWMFSYFSGLFLFLLLSHWQLLCWFPFSSLPTEISMQSRHDGACPTTSKLSNWVGNPGFLTPTLVLFLVYYATSEPLNFNFSKYSS